MIHHHYHYHQYHRFYVVVVDDFDMIMEISIVDFLFENFPDLKWLMILLDNMMI